MTRVLVAGVVVLGAVLVSGCGGLRSAVDQVRGGQDPFAAPDPWGGIPPELRSGGRLGQQRTRVVLDGEDPAAVERRRNRGPQTTVLTPEEDIEWTDPDNPDAPLLSEAMIRSSKTRGSWEESYSEAKKYALREGKPLLIWFTDSKRSPVCQTLSAELFSTPDFDTWARQNVVRLRLDFNVQSDSQGENQMDVELRKRAYLKVLEERLNASGKPHILVLAPDGTTIGRYRGYKPGGADFFWGQLKHSTILAQKHHDDWVEEMEKRGYRTWANRRGDFTTFAKLLRYRDGELILGEPDGARFRTEESNLSDDDRLWIAGQKARRQ